VFTIRFRGKPYLAVSRQQSAVSQKQLSAVSNQPSAISRQPNSSQPSAPVYGKKVWLIAEC
jgi:hypothetical protein